MHGAPKGRGKREFAFGCFFAATSRLLSLNCYEMLCTSETIISSLYNPFYIMFLSFFLSFFFFLAVCLCGKTRFMLPHLIYSRRRRRHHNSSVLQRRINLPDPPHDIFMPRRLPQRLLRQRRRPRPLATILFRHALGYVSRSRQKVLGGYVRAPEPPGAAARRVKGVAAVQHAQVVEEHALAGLHLLLVDGGRVVDEGGEDPGGLEPAADVLDGAEVAALEGGAPEDVVEAGVVAVDDAARGEVVEAVFAVLVGDVVFC